MTASASLPIVLCKLLAQTSLQIEKFECRWPDWSELEGHLWWIILRVEDKANDIQGAVLYLVAIWETPDCAILELHEYVMVTLHSMRESVCM